MRADRRSPGVWPSARRWLVVAGLLSGAWFAGAAYAAADEVAVPGLADSAEAGQSAVQEGPDQLEETAEDTGAAEGSGASANTDSAESAGPSDSAGSGSRDQGTRPDTPEGGVGTAVQDGVDTVATEAVGSKDGAEAASKKSSGSSAASSSSESSESDRRKPAAERISGTVAAVSKVGTSVPASVTSPGTPASAAAVSEAAAENAAHGLPAFSMTGFDPSGLDGAEVLPGLGADDESDADTVPGAGRVQDPAGPAGRGTGSAPGLGESAQAFSAAAPVADHAGFAPYGGPAAEAVGDDDSGPRDSGVDRPEAAAAVGSGVNTAQPGGMCAGYLPAAATAAPAAGMLQCARQALADVPQDLGEKPTFSPD
ncbi:hypothetical protein LP52_24430 [Streptomonospora alba]|uniref:Uncharacterized protein n=1 Tax=Streptomonospora alba TaxID=183763 RepID=A0A0C2FBL8_9ACTN|nr:hypothetical protein LP52_24430 [Streptomonospora alba]